MAYYPLPIVVLNEVIGSVAQVEKEAVKVLWVKEQLLDVLMTTDSDMDAMISKDIAINSSSMWNPLT